MSNLPNTLAVLVNGMLVELQGRFSKPGPDPSKPRNWMYEAKLNVPINSGRHVEDILGESVVTYNGEVLKRGDVHTSKINQAWQTGGNITVTHSLVVDLGAERKYQMFITLTGLEKDGGPVIRIMGKCQIRPFTGSTVVGAIEAGASF